MKYKYCFFIALAISVLLLNLIQHLTICKAGSITKLGTTATLLPSGEFGSVFDDFNDGNLKNNWGYFTFSDGTGGTCTKSYVGGAYEGENCLKLDYNVPGAGSFSWYASKMGSENIESSNFNGLIFWVKGAAGGEYFKIELKTIDCNSIGRSNAKIYITDYLDGGVTTDWQKVVIPLKNFANITNFTKMYELTIAFEHDQSINNGSPTSGTVYIDCIKFTNVAGGFDIVRIDHYGDKDTINALGGQMGDGGDGSINVSLTSEDFYGYSNSLKIDYDVSGGMVYVFSFIGGGTNGWSAEQCDFSNYDYFTFWVKSTNGVIYGNGTGHNNTTYWPWKGIKVVTDIDDNYENDEYFLHCRIITSTWHKFYFELDKFQYWDSGRYLDKSKIAKFMFVIDGAWLQAEDHVGTVYIDKVQFEVHPQPEEKSVYKWTKKMGGYYTDTGFAIATDTSDNIYITGYFEGTVNFAEDWDGTDDKTSTAGSSDIFITRINADGSYGWTKGMGGSGGDNGYAIATDTSDNIYITGNFEGTVNFAEDWDGTDNKTNAGSRDIFITRINADGSYGWTKSMGESGGDNGYAIATDTSDNIYITGYFMATVNFADDWDGTDNKTSDGLYDIFITRINADGSYGWTKRMGGSSFDNGREIATDTSGNIYITGSFEGTVNFAKDWDGTDDKISAGDDDIFITRINADGSYGWTKSMGGSDEDDGYAIATDTSDNIYITGSFEGTVNFKKDWGGTDNKSAGKEDIFITRINADGSYGWTKRMGGSGYFDNGYAIATDTSDNIYITGYFEGTVNFKEDWDGIDNKTPTDMNIFITRINADGSYGWTKSMGGSGSENIGYAIAIDTSDNIYITGRFGGTVNFAEDWDGTDDKISAGGSSDIFVTVIAPIIE